MSLKQKTDYPPSKFQKEEFKIDLEHEKRLANVKLCVMYVTGSIFLINLLMKLCFNLLLHIKRYACIG